MVETPALGWIAILAFSAVLIGGVGLLLLGAIWLAMRFLRKPCPVPTATGHSTHQLQVHHAAEGEANTAILTVASNLAPTPLLNPIVTTVPFSEPTEAAIAAHGSELDVEAHSLMSGFERSFFWALSQAVRNDYYIFPQIPLRELARLNGKASASHDLRGMFARGVVDFLLIDPTMLDAVLALEFDDPSHRQADSQARARRKDEFLRRMGLPLLRFRSGSKWNADLLRQQIEEAIVPHCRVSFLQHAERELFHSLREARPDLFIFPKVPLNQLIRRRDWLPLEEFKTLEHEMVDFVLAHPRYLGTMLVVVMGDSDMAKANLLERAGVRRLRIGTGEIATPMFLRAKITGCSI